MVNLADMKQYVISTFIAQTLVASLQYIPIKECFFNFLNLIGLKTYYVMDMNVVKRVQKRLTDKCNIMSDERGFGSVWGMWYFVNIWDNSLMIISSKKKYSELTEEFQESKVTVEKRPVTVYDKNGPYSYNWYDRRKIYIHDVTSWPCQESIIGRIMDEYKTKKHTVALLHGPPGCGKSMTGLLLTLKLKGSFCNIFKPWMPNSTLSALYSAVAPSEDSPLIIGMDEFDGPLLKIHNGEIPINEKLPTLITDKTGWNLFFDEVQRGMYPFVIILLTTNKSPQFFNELDPSYIRKGRIDLIEEMGWGDLSPQVKNETL